MTTKQKKAIKAMQAARKVHHNVDGKLVCGEERRAGIRNQEDISLVTCEDCKAGKKRRVKKAAAKSTEKAVGKIEVKANTPKTPIKAADADADTPKAPKKAAQTAQDANGNPLATLTVGNVRVVFLPVG